MTTSKLRRDTETSTSKRLAFGAILTVVALGIWRLAVEFPWGWSWTTW